MGCSFLCIGAINVLVCHTPWVNCPVIAAGPMTIVGAIWVWLYGNCQILWPCDLGDLITLWISDIFVTISSSKLVDVQRNTQIYNMRDPNSCCKRRIVLMRAAPCLMFSACLQLMSCYNEFRWWLTSEFMPLLSVSRVIWPLIALWSSENACSIV